FQTFSINMQYINGGLIDFNNINDGLQYFGTVKNGEIGCKRNFLRHFIFSLFWNNHRGTFYLGDNIARIRTNGNFFNIGPTLGPHYNEIYLLLYHLFPNGVDYRITICN